MSKDFSQEYILKNGIKVLLRTAEESDAQSYSVLLHRCGEETDNLSFGAEDCPYTVEYSRDLLRAAGENPADISLLAFVDGELVGEVGIVAQGRRASHTGELGICILQKYCGIGLGTLLMETVLDLSKKAGKLQSICLTAMADNQVGLHLYERCGFREYGRYKKNICIDGQYYDLVLMNLYF